MPPSYPLSEAQYGIILDWIQHPQLTQYNVSGCYTCPATIDAGQLYRCLQVVVERHDIFYTRIVNEGDHFSQHIDRSQHIELGYHETTDEDFDTFRNHFVRPINIFSDTLIRMAIVKTPQHTCLLIDGSHLIIDGLSCHLIWHELADTYTTSHVLPRSAEGRLQGKDSQTPELLNSRAPELPFSLYVSQEQEQLQTEAYKKASEYYQTEFEGYAMTRIASRRSEAVGTFQRVSTSMPKNDVEQYCQAHGVTPNIVFMAAYAITLSAFSGEQRVGFYSVNHGRNDRHWRNIIGMFVKTVPFKADLTDGNLLVTDFIRSFKQQMMNNIRHGIYPFNRFCRQHNCQPETSFNFHVTTRTVAIADTTAIAEQYYSGQTADSIAAQVWDDGDSYQILIDYNDQRYDLWLIQQMADTIRSITENIMCHPDATLATLPLVSYDEARHILEVSTGEQLPTPADYEHDFVSMFLHQVQQTPTAIALVDHTGSLTYEELDQRSSQLARYLVSEKGVMVGDRVVIMLPRSKDFMVAVIAVMKAGACYVPIDINYPDERVRYIITDCSARCILTLLDLQERLADQELSTLHAPLSTLHSQLPAYIIYTSGSTGQPKGVVISHRALASFVRTCRHTYQLTSDDRILCHASFSFDASIEDLFPILTCGGELHILDEAIRTDLPAIKTYIENHHITGGNYTTAFGELLLMSYPELPLRYITLGGERLDRMPQGLTCRFFNSYGPTEFTVDATFWEAPENQLQLSTINYQLSTIKETTPPIGRPVCDCQALVLDYFGRILPLGCPGELCLSGPQIADGYWKRSELTAERFVDGKFRTGDFVRWNEERQLEYIGRHDRLVKLNGFRIELGEIEATIMARPNIVQAVVLVREVNGNERLCAWFTASQLVDTAKLKASLSQSMPHYMVPTIYQQIDAIPLTTNGKIDTLALLNSSTPALGQRTLVRQELLKEERILHDIICEALDLGAVSIDADLFSDLALTSLQAAGVAFKAMKQGLNINVSTLYSARTIRQVIAASSPQLFKWIDNSPQELLQSSTPELLAKPIMLLISGYVHLHPKFDAFIDIFHDRFNIFAIESFTEFFRDGRPVSYNYLMEQYTAIVNRELCGKHISLIVGECYGSELALLLADRIKEQFDHPRVLVLDGIYRRSDVIEEVPESGRDNETLVEYTRISNELALQLPEPLYDGEVLFCYAGTIPPYRSSEFPDQQLTPAEQEEFRVFSHENHELWCEHYPHASFYRLDHHHYEFLSRENLLDVAQVLKNHWNL